MLVLNMNNIYLRTLMFPSIDIMITSVSSFQVDDFLKINVFAVLF